MNIMCNRTSREYEIAKQFFIDNHHTKTEEGRKLIAERNKGNQYNKGKTAPPRSVTYRQKQRESHNKSYEITYDDGKTITICGMKQFAKDNDYNHSHLIQIGKGNRKTTQKHHRG